MEAWRDELYHHGIKGQKWGVRRYQNADGSLTEAGKRRVEKLRGEAINEHNKAMLSYAVAEDSAENYRIHRDRGETRKASNYASEGARHYERGIEYEKRARKLDQKLKALGNSGLFTDGNSALDDSRVDAGRDYVEKKRAKYMAQRMAVPATAIAIGTAAAFIHPSLSTMMIVPVGQHINRYELKKD